MPLALRIFPTSSLTTELVEPDGRPDVHITADIEAFLRTAT
jgi:hypothetical protein